MLRYSVYENETLKAVFVSEIDAINYKTLLKNIADIKIGIQSKMKLLSMRRERRAFAFLLN